MSQAKRVTKSGINIDSKQVWMVDGVIRKDIMHFLCFNYVVKDTAMPYLNY